MELKKTALIFAALLTVSTLPLLLFSCAKKSVPYNGTEDPLGK